MQHRDADRAPRTCRSCPIELLGPTSFAAGRDARDPVPGPGARARAGDVRGDRAPGRLDAPAEPRRARVRPERRAAGPAPAADRAPAGRRRGPSAAFALYPEARRRGGRASAARSGWTRCRSVVGAPFQGRLTLEMGGRAQAVQEVRAGAPGQGPVDGQRRTRGDHHAVGGSARRARASSAAARPRTIRSRATVPERLAADRSRREHGRADAAFHVVIADAPGRATRTWSATSRSARRRSSEPPPSAQVGTSRSSRARAAARARRDPVRRRPADDVARRERAVDRGGRPQRVADPRVGGERRGVGVAARAEGHADHAVRRRASRSMPGGLGLGHERADDVVGGTERDPAPDQGVGHRGRGRVALGRPPRASAPRRR